ncbi:MAG: AAA family ATPase, partial [Campylobacterota bacterium]|nr:AAA family ATPase [Campylobacterota bacterium]
INNKYKSINNFETHALNFILSNRKSLLNKNQTKQKLVICSSINRKLVKEYLHIVLNYINIKSDKDFKINEYDTHAYKTISTYYFNADMIKTSSHQDNITKLKKDGSNLGKNLVHLKQNSPNSFEIVSNSMITTVNEIDGIDVQKTFGNYLIGFEENNSIIGIDKVSNGTINLLATITALNQPQNKNILLAFEEPERHLHLKAVNYLLEAFRSNEKQILITTHSTEILKHANIEEIIFTYRDSDGDTQAIRADEIPDLEGKMERLGYERPLSLDELIGCNIVGKFE